MERPVVVSVISWYVIINTLLTAANIIVSAFSGFYEGEFIYHIVANVLVLLAALPAILMLNGKNIGRILYILLGMFSYGSLIYRFGNSPQFLIGLIAPISLFVIFIILLYQPKVNDYFSGGLTNKEKENNS